MQRVYVLSHIHPSESKNDEKLIGVYRTEKDANAAIQRLRSKPGFSSYPDEFVIDSYELNKDHWTEGYFTE